MLKSVYAIPHAPPRLRVPESVEHGEDGSRSTERKTVTYVSFPHCLPIAVLTGRLQWENVANTINVVIFGNPYVSYTGVTRVQKISELRVLDPSRVADL